MKELLIYAVVIFVGVIALEFILYDSDQTSNRIGIETQSLSSDWFILN